MSLVFMCNFRQIYAVTRIYSIIIRNSHYDTLRLKKNCTEKQIKEAFVKLSKQYHPDVNKDAKAQEKFVKIVEAYNVLSKPNTRAHYDITHNQPSAYVHRTHATYSQPRNYTDYSYYYSEPNRDRQYNSNNSETKHDSDQNYYGVAGLKKLPNAAIIILCFGFAVLGLILQMIVIRNNFNSHQRKVDEKSRISSEHYAAVRQRAVENGNEMQARILLEKIVNAANQSTATASLGQALATDKKDMKALSEPPIQDFFSFDITKGLGSKN